MGDWLSRFFEQPTIRDSSGADMSSRSNIKFTGATVTDDPSNDQTIIEPGGSSPATFEQTSESFAASLSTSNATPTAFATGGLPYIPPVNSAFDVIVTIIGKKALSSDVFCQDYRARYFRTLAGTFLIGTVIVGANPVGTGSLATASATVLLNANTIAPQVTGVAATDVSWTCTMQVQLVTTA